ncbi:MAG: hypothetical protein ACI9KE_002185 [Polyangiales bacterium]|jgi:hypothetical protein
MEAQFNTDDYRPREEDARIVLTSEPAKVPVRAWVIATGVGVLALWSAIQYGRLDVAAAALLPMLFLFVGARVLTKSPPRTVLRFLDEGVELDTPGQGWVRVPWDLITRLVQDGVGGASLDTGTVADGGRSVARLPKDQLDKLLAAAVLPAHVELIEAPPGTPAPHNAKRTFVLWLLLIVAFVVIWQLVQK